MAIFTKQERTGHESLNQKEFISSKHMQKGKKQKPLGNKHKEMLEWITHTFTDSRQEVRYRMQENNL